MAWADYQWDFFRNMWPLAQSAGEQLGVNPEVIFAQSALETGWGRYSSGNNYFGVKSHGQSGGFSSTTQEYINGNQVTITDNFRSYDDMNASVAGYVDFISTNPRYGEFIAAGSIGQELEALQASGYATDPNYAASLGSIIANMPAETEASNNTGISLSNWAGAQGGVLNWLMGPNSILADISGIITGERSVPEALDGVIPSVETWVTRAGYVIVGAIFLAGGTFGLLKR